MPATNNYDMSVMANMNKMKEDFQDQKLPHERETNINSLKYGRTLVFHIYALRS